jgi:glycosyl transferase, family 25
MTIHVISLQRTPQRLADFQSHNSHLEDYRIFPAIDGSTVDLGQLQLEGYVDHSLTYSLGAIGNALSHIKLWERASAHEEALTIVEDDSLLHRDFCAMSRNLISQLPRDWDLVMWGWNADGLFAVDFGLGPMRGRFDQQAVIAGMNEYLRTPVSPSLHKLVVAFGTHCYSISPNGAKKFLRRVRPLRNMPVVTPYREYSNQSLDCMMNNFYRGFRCYAAMPPAALTVNDKSVSTVFPSLDLAEAAYRHKDFAEAERLCHEMLEVDPRYFAALHLQGAVCVSMGHMARAAELLRKAIGFEPSSVAAHNDLAVVLVGLKRHDEALKILEIAVSLDPANAEAHANIGRVLQQMGRVSDAILAFDKALAAKPQSEEIARSRSMALSELNKSR